MVDGWQGSGGSGSGLEPGYEHCFVEGAFGLPLGILFSPFALDADEWRALVARASARYAELEGLDPYLYARLHEAERQAHKQGLLALLAYREQGRIMVVPCITVRS